ncbi:hypothetical protein AB9F41_33330, partial [Rhizobium leguminosarum]|uniref:hypothetical protein n=1 Tax=Rhizobium leguminosarum TaxID=384 RepID=UPI003F943BEE
MVETVAAAPPLAGVDPADPSPADPANAISWRNAPASRRAAQRHSAACSSKMPLYRRRVSKPLRPWEDQR